MENLQKLKSRVTWACENKINAFSPTISPAFKNKERNEIESILEAVKYYVQRGQNKLVFQKKYMGSYCDIYLHKTIEESYLVSRNAYKINNLDNNEVVLALQALHTKLDWTETKLYIIQSELLPWHVLGKNLIDNDFGGYLHVHEKHAAYMQQSNIYNKIALVKNSEAYLGYMNEKTRVSSKELSQIYPSHVVRQYEAVSNFKLIDMPEYLTGISVYKKQLEHFGNETAMQFKPFNILKRVFDNGTEELPNSNLTYTMVNDDGMKVLDIDADKDIEPQLKEVYNWYDSLCNDLEEGIMIKPVVAFVQGLPPAFKVRNNNYLTLIYGIDFISNYKENMGKRNIKRKLECSIKDWMLNWELIKTPYNKIDQENYEFKNLLIDRIIGEALENNLDHRL